MSVSCGYTGHRLSTQSLLPYLLLLLLHTTPSNAQAPCACNTSQVWDALAALHRSTGGATWLHQDSWLLAGSSVCEWYGVSACTDLQLGANKLNGTLPAELSLLSATTFVSLNFSDNSISGTLPLQLAALSQLQHFFVYKNRLSGTLPSVYANWTQLRQLFVHINNISGSLPPEYASWSRLELCYVHTNSLGGTLPPAYANWTQLIDLIIHSNNISGSLPLEYASWSQFQAFHVYTNHLSGTLPPAYASWTHLRELFVDNNNISGLLPPEYASWSRFRQLRARKNRLSGTLPPAYASWTHLRELFVDNNNISGSLPPEYASWSQLQRFSAHTNRLSGTLPPAFANWTQLRELSVYGNIISGSLPSEYSAWVLTESLIFSSNQIAGTIPPAYGKLLSLGVFAMNYNRLSGIVPPLRVAQLLALSNNPNLTGTLSASMGLVLLVVLCNTSVCGPLPLLWSAGFTKIVCVPIDTAISRDLVSELLKAPPYAVPTCRTAAPAPPSALARVFATSSLSIPGDAAGAVGVAAAALAAGSGATATTMQLSLRTAVIAQRMASCRRNAANDAGAAESSAVGALVADNPLRVSLSGNLPLTLGAVLGNTMLLVAVPMLFAAGTHFLTCGATRRPADRAATSSAHGLQLVWSVVQVPTVAASVLLVIETARAVTVVGGVVCGAGCALCASMTTLTVSCWVRVRGCDGQHQPLPVRGAAQPPCTVRLRQLFLRPRSTWRCVTLVQPLGTRSHVRRSIAQQAARWVASVRAALAQQLLSVCHYPHSWVIVYDAVAAVLAGVLVGVASAPHVSCEVVGAVAWAALGVAAVQAVVAVAVRPRCSIADCVFDAVMCTWTAVGTLLAALGIEEGSEEYAVAQGSLALLCAVPAVGLRVHRLRCAESTPTHRSFPGRRSAPSALPVRHSSPAFPVRPVRGCSRAEMMSRQEALQSVVQRICAARRRDRALPGLEGRLKVSAET